MRYASMACLVLSLALTGCSAASNFSAAQDKARNASVKANMRTLQLAAESYATDNGGAYPKAIDDSFKSYMPGGGSDGKTPAPDGLTNPFDSKKEWPTMGTITALKAGSEKPVSITAGTIQYSSLDGGKSYAIIGGAAGDQELTTDDGKPVVLSNNDLK